MKTQACHDYCLVWPNNLKGQMQGVLHCSTAEHVRRLIVLTPGPHPHPEILVIQCLSSSHALVSIVCQQPIQQRQAGL